MVRFSPLFLWQNGSTKPQRLFRYITLLVAFVVSTIVILSSSYSDRNEKFRNAIRNDGLQKFIQMKAKEDLTVGIQSDSNEISFYNEWFRKYFKLFDYKGHTHHKSLPSYYPIKAQKLFTKYIILSQLNDKYKCKLNISNKTVKPSKTFQHFKIGQTSSNYWIDYDSFYCETLLTLTGYLLWKINFFIIEDSSITKNKMIRDFEIRINANNPNNENEIIRTSGKVRDPIFDDINMRWKYPADFYIHEPNLYHSIYPIHTYDNRYFEFKHSISSDLGREYPLKLFQNGTDHTIISKYYESKFSQQLRPLKAMNIPFNIDDYLDDLEQMKYYGSTLKNTPFQVMVEFEDYKYDENLPNLFCDEPMFHFDSYQSEIPHDIVMMINSETIKLSENVSIFVLPKRIGRWVFIPPQKREGNWMEADCKWKRFDLIEEIERKIFANSNMQFRFWGASNYQHIMTDYWRDLCPTEDINDVKNNGLKCTKPENEMNNGITFEWQFYRGSCMKWPYAESQGCADIWTDKIVKHEMNQYEDSQHSCNYLFGLTRQEPNNRLSNITFLVNGLWTQRYSNISHILRLYNGIEYMFEDCWNKFEDRMNEMGFFYKQSFATSAAPTHKPELARFINHQLENYIELALKTIMEKKVYLIGVIWSFQRTFTRHLTNDKMHQDSLFYTRHNRDIFNELFRYIPSNMHQRCMSQFNHDCLMSMIRN